MSKVSDFARLTAIALLNVADDEGYFEADVRLVRGDVFPFEEDSSRIKGALSELSVIGYIEIREHPTKGPLGHVVTFSTHQRINRATGSKLKKHFDDAGQKCGKLPGETVAHGDISEISVIPPEDARLEQGRGTGKRNSGKEELNVAASGSPPVALIEDEWEIPGEMDTPEVRELLGRFEAMRKRIRKPIKSKRDASATLRRFDDAAHLVFALETCIANDYQGLKPDYKPPRSASQPQKSRVATAETLANWRATGYTE